MATAPDDRYATALEFAEALTAQASPGGVFGKLKEKLT